MITSPTLRPAVDAGPVVVSLTMSAPWDLVVAGVSLVIGWCFLERLPLLTIMAKDDQCHVLTLDQVQKFARAGAQLLLVLKRPGLSISGKKALQDNRVD